MFVAMLCAASLHASSLTPIVTTAENGEPGLFEILDDVYGAGTYTRISDDLDKFFGPAVIYDVSIVATYSAAVQQLGICVLCDGTDDQYFDQQFGTDGTFSAPMTMGGNSSVEFLDAPFRLFANPTGAPVVGRVYSDPSLNLNGFDHMVSFSLAGQPNTFVFAWEDWTAPGADWDFNDFVVQMRIEPPPLTPVPEPSTYALLAVGTAFLLWRKKRKG
jgi:hypothetical protein